MSGKRAKLIREMVRSMNVPVEIRTYLYRKFKRSWNNTPWNKRVMPTSKQLKKYEVEHVYN